VLLTIFDLILMYLTWKEYVKLKRERDERKGAVAAKPSESQA
jgi:uncharacterized membrane protein